MISATRDLGGGAAHVQAAHQLRRLVELLDLVDVEAQLAVKVGAKAPDDAVGIEHLRWWRAAGSGARDASPIVPTYGDQVQDASGNTSRMHPGCFRR